ncbi:hypothetical protein HX871_28610 [Pseudomonas reactans]|uniref:Uncharacterized protein n=1 Tax=Pseudomonas reactans TaxID=117680 RepID=A0ABX2R358_9PSED|nr:DUF5677 domain-containing protein [Pseudomonas reactans]NWA43492.1 hypothetical protein [Pseudomonas reactans]NWC88376.1 hypothetical protein [Pseudomonas reactans]NWD30255.1 hypothetical protein [Pseudomonas reactans]NWD98393.1 hypothetical protein [Pseudomonas reactans]
MDQASVDDLYEKGFLSPAIEKVRESYKSTYRKSFEEAETASGVAQLLVMGAGADRYIPHQMASLVFFHKLVRSCQAAILLCERGLIVDAQTLCRSAVEALFHAVALINDPSVFVRMCRAGDIEDRKQAKAMIKSLAELGLSEKNIQDLNEVISRAEGEGAGFSTFEAAQVAGLIPLYETMYRGLSSVASHATFRSMDSSLLVRDGEPVLITGPTDYHLEFTLGILKTCLDISSNRLRDSFVFEE